MQLNCVWNGHVINTRAKPVPTPYPTCHTSDHMPSLLFCPTFVRRCPLYLWPNRLPNSPALLPPSLFYDPEDPGPGAGCRRQAVVVWWCSFSTVKQFLLPLLSPSPAASRCRGRLSIQPELILAAWAQGIFTALSTQSKRGSLLPGEGVGKRVPQSLSRELPHPFKPETQCNGLYGTPTLFSTGLR